MKLHETSVLGYSRMGAPPDRRGRLYKKSERSSSYQRRWCELRGNLLFYWERQGEREPLGLILLEGCTVELQESATEPFTFEISYSHGSSVTCQTLLPTHRTQESWFPAPLPPTAGDAR
uniref:PH domain-containing protein n=1 Tax=Chelonoidis abingdonii TaxID=106734 RepID=A0A8C0G5Y3_CHEAB